MDTTTPATHSNPNPQPMPKKSRKWLVLVLVLLVAVFGLVAYRNADLFRANLLVRPSLLKSNINLNVPNLSKEIRLNQSGQDLCAGVVCSQGLECRDGRCVDVSCAGVVCEQGLICKDGRCLDEACVGVLCGQGLSCRGGKCLDLACEGVVCSQGAYCEQGACRPNPVCGNGKVEKDEQCDDGNAVSETACAYRTLSCETCNSNCTAKLILKGPYCGDSAVQSAEGEQCDDGNVLNTDNCIGTCQSAKCGDGFVWAGHETCDEGSMNGIKSHCNSTCSGIKK